MKSVMVSLRLRKETVEIIQAVSEVCDSSRSELLRNYIIDGLDKSVKELPDGED